eukprot:g556.t1
MIPDISKNGSLRGGGSPENGDDQYDDDDERGFSGAGAAPVTPAPALTNPTAAAGGSGNRTLLAARSMAPDSAAGLRGRGQLMRVVLYQRTVERTAHDRPPNITTELFVDLMTATVLGTLRYFFWEETYRKTPDPAQSTLCSFVVLFFPLWWASFETMVFMNRFTCGDCAFNLYVLGFVVLVMCMNNNLLVCKNECLTNGATSQVCVPAIEAPPGDYTTFALLKAALFVWVTLPYLKAAAHVPRQRLWCQIRVLTNVLSAIVSVIASTTVSVARRRAMGMAVVLLQLCVEFVLTLPGRPWHFPSQQVGHLGKRMAKFTLMVLAQALGSVNQRLANWTSAGYAVLVGIMFMCLVLKIVYFDIDRVNLLANMAHVVGAEWLWIAGHLLFAMSLIVFGASAQVLAIFANRSGVSVCSVTADKKPSSPFYFKWLFCVSFGMLVLISAGLLLVVDLATARVASGDAPPPAKRHRISKRHRALFRAFVAVLMMLLPFVINSNLGDDDDGPDGSANATAGAPGAKKEPLRITAANLWSVAVECVWLVATLLGMVATFTIYGVGERVADTDTADSGGRRGGRAHYRWRGSLLMGHSTADLGVGGGGRGLDAFRPSLLDGAFLGDDADDDDAIHAAGVPTAAGTGAAGAGAGAGRRAQTSSGGASARAGGQGSGRGYELGEMVVRARTGGAANAVSISEANANAGGGSVRGTFVPPSPLLATPSAGDADGGGGAVESFLSSWQTDGGAPVASREPAAAATRARVRAVAPALATEQHKSVRFAVAGDDDGAGGGERVMGGGAGGSEHADHARASTPPHAAHAAALRRDAAQRSGRGGAGVGGASRGAPHARGDTRGERARQESWARARHRSMRSTDAAGGTMPSIPSPKKL